ncbi:unnamed protein product [Lactuca saligna]|uniref:Uncharacterized protein n=1 Tax=Lactuca saligna TaxID=75948 RepID=A0AA36E4B2_LACSI|nr:unnamed protein product [Lactuca saligna]
MDEHRERRKHEGSQAQLRRSTARSKESVDDQLLQSLMRAVPASIREGRKAGAIISGGASRCAPANQEEERKEGRKEVVTSLFPPEINTPQMCFLAAIWRMKVSSINLSDGVGRSKGRERIGIASFSGDPKGWRRWQPLCTRNQILKDIRCKIN